MTNDQVEKLCEALYSAFVSPNVSDANMEPANLVDAVDGLARTMRVGMTKLGLNNAISTGGVEFGAIEFLAKEIRDAGDAANNGLCAIAVAIDNLADAVEKRA